MPWFSCSLGLVPQDLRPPSRDERGMHFSFAGSLWASHFRDPGVIDFPIRTAERNLLQAPWWWTSTVATKELDVVHVGRTLDVGRLDGYSNQSPKSASRTRVGSYRLPLWLAWKRPWQGPRPALGPAGPPQHTHDRGLGPVWPSQGRSARRYATVF